jgi:hypothetical protein
MDVDAAPTTDEATRKEMERETREKAFTAGKDRSF